jgi:hypothetical protein
MKCSILSRSIGAITYLTSPLKVRQSTSFFYHQLFKMAALLFRMNKMPKTTKNTFKQLHLLEEAAT